jgi:GTPase
VDNLLYRVRALLDTLPPLEEPVEDDFVDVGMPLDEKAFSIHREDEELWRVSGIAVERAAQMTNWDYYEAAMRFQRILRALGIADALREAGIEEGHTVQIGEVELVWGYDNAFE